MVCQGTCGVFLSVLLSAVGMGQRVTTPAIKKLPNVKPNAGVFDKAGKRAPLVIRSQKKAAEHFSEHELTKLMKKVDYQQQTVLVFAWRGSGQDRLGYAVQDSFPEQVVFTFRPGRTRDLRPHTEVFVLHSNVMWRVAGARTRPSDKSTNASDYIQVEVRGKLNSEVFAIGGETTGFVISAGGVELELDFSGNARLRRKAKRLHQKTVVVKGRLSAKRGVEIRRRLIVAVDSLDELSTSNNENLYLKSDGTLRHPLTLRDSQSGFAGQTGHLWTIKPDGSWTRQSFLNDKLRPVDLKGKLDKEQINALAKVLVQFDLAGLPKSMGQDVGVNPHVFTIAFGTTQSRLVLLAGAPLPPADPETARSPQQRFAALAHALQKSLKTPG